MKPISKNKELNALRSELGHIKDAYLKVKENEARYKRLIEASPDISYIFGSKTGAKYWSPQIEKILGIVPATITRDPFAWINAIHPEDQLKVKDLINSTNKRKEFSIEYRVRDTHGHWHWFNDRSISVNKVKDEYLIEGIAQDITERKKIEEELRSSEELFRKAFMTSPDAININRFYDGMYVSINHGFTKIMGYTEEDIIGKTSLKLNIWKDPIDRKRLVAELSQNGQVENLEASFIAKNGEIKIGLMSATVIELNGKKHILNITRDITERVAINKKLLDNQFILEKAQELGKIGGWEMDFVSNNLSWSNESYTIFGLAPGTPVDFDLFVHYVHPDDRSFLLAKWEDALHGVPFDIEHRIVSGENTKWVRQNAVFVTDNKGKLVKAIGTIQDITERRNIEDALRESEEKYRLIVEGANDGIEITQNDKILYSNSRFAEILGYSQEEIQNVPFSDIFSEDAKHDLAKRHDDRSKGLPLPTRYETTFLKKNGELINVDVNYQIIEFQNNPATFATIRDITDSKKMEKELRKLSTAVEQSPSVIAITDMAGHLEYVNPKFIEVTGYSLDEVIGQTPKILKSGELPDDIYRELWNTILSGNTWRGEFRNKKKTGELYWENAAITPILDADGGMTHLLKVAEDITEWKNIEEALRQSEEKYRLIVENANDGIIISQDDQFIYSNAQFAEMMGYNLEELNQISFKAIYTDQGIKDLFSRHDKRIKGENVPNHYETSFRRKDDRIIIVDVNYQIIDYHQKPATFAIVRDITKQKEAEIALINALEKAEESDRLKSAFLANMSHEIRTPMNGIMGFAKLLRKKDLSGEKRNQYLDVIEQSSHRMLNIINDLIDISKIESGQMETHQSNTNVNDIIDFIYNFFDPECTSKNIRLQAHKYLQDQDAEIVTDKDKLEAVLINLLKNAIKFTHKGNIDFGYALVENTLEFFVRDTGIGIPKEKQSAIFDRFVQADSSMSKPYEGAGLGLSISKAFVEMLGGELKLESETNMGSRFFFTVPYSLPTADSEIKQSPDTENIQKNDSLSHDLKVIIAEDDEPSFLYLNILMQPYCSTILHARNGKEVIDLSRENPDIDLILMDVKMPLLDGYEATRAIREFNQDVVIVAQTAYAFSDDQEKILLSGCDTFITKPIQENDLAELVKRYFKV